MVKIGIIVEYNPFHNGHLYHINKIKEMYPDSMIIAVMSGNFTQRGEASILNKWEKTDLALFYGVDLVVELPFAFATESADTFASASVEILNHLKVDKIVFGSETNNIDLFIKCASIQLNDKKYNKYVKEYLDDGYSYPTALSKSLFKITGKNISKPNDILALSYVREILRQNSNIEPVSIKRNNDFNSIELNSSITSAASIRYALSHAEDVSTYVPKQVSINLEGKLAFTSDYFPYIKYKMLTCKDLSIYQTMEEGIENRFLKYIISSKTLDEFILKIKTKRYTTTKINRMLLHILTDYTKEEKEEMKIDYIRILGFNSKGRDYLNEIKKDIDIPLLVKFSSIKSKALELELRSTIVYASIFDEATKQKIIESEYKNGPIIY